MKNKWFKSLTAALLAASMAFSQAPAMMAETADSAVQEVTDASYTLSDDNSAVNGEDAVQETEELRETTDAVAINTESLAEEASVIVSQSAVTIEEGETAQIDVEAAGVKGSYTFEATELGKASEAGFEQTDDSAVQTLTIRGLEEGSNICTVAVRDSSTDRIVATKSITVKTLEGTSKTANNVNATVTSTKKTVYVAVGTTATFYLDCKNTDARYHLNRSTYDTNLFTHTWGDWNGGRMPVKITSKKTGKATLTYSLVDEATGKAVSTCKVNVVIVAKNFVRTTSAELHIKRAKVVEVKYAIYGRTKGATYKVTVGNKNKLRTAWGSKTGSSATVKICGLQKGGTVLNFFVMKDGKVLGKRTVKVYITDTGVVDYSYKFANSYSGLGVSASYKYPYAVFTKLFGNNVYARNLMRHVNSYGWGGDCYGMSTTAAMMYYMNLPTVFRKNTVRANQLSIYDKNAGGMNVRFFIQAMMMAQYSDVETSRSDSRYNNQAYCGDQIVTRTKAGQPVAIGLYMYDGGHEVLGYAAKVSGSSARVYIYDPNYPNETHYVDFTYSSGHWRYPEFDSYYVTAIDFTTYAEIKSMWDKRGHLVPRSSMKNMLSINSRDFTVLDKNGRTVAKVSGGKLVTSSEEISMAQPKMKGTREATLLYLPTAEYTIVNNGKNKQLEISMTNVENGATVKTSAKKVTLNVSDVNRTNKATVKDAKDKSYSIILESTASGMPSKMSYAGKGAGKNVTAGVAKGKQTGDTNAKKAK